MYFFSLDSSEIYILLKNFEKVFRKLKRKEKGSGNNENDWKIQEPNIFKALQRLIELVVRYSICIQYTVYNKLSNEHEEIFVGLVMKINNIHLLYISQISLLMSYQEHSYKI